LSAIRLDQVICAIIDISAKMTPEASSVSSMLCSGLWLFMCSLKVITGSGYQVEVEDGDGNEFTFDEEGLGLVWG
jgi:hypothetical protein